MKKFFVLLGLSLLIAGAVSAQVARGGTLYAATKTVQLKSSTGFFAKTNGTLAYGDVVTVLQVKGKWVEVRSNSRSALTGWTQSANLSAKRVLASSGTGSASASEIAMAGKGFSEEVENAYKAEGKDLNYGAVDATEAIKVTEQDLYNFITEGHLLLGDN
ncbi:hypothetical protein FACS189491_00960 [Spirochaetia bacterium]|nr:hypothetical protein FACS189491_00960 [Spirochaetia bacterium]